MTLDKPIAAACLLLVVLLLAFFLVIPTYERLKALQLSLAQKQSQYNAQYDYYDGITKSYFDIQGQQTNIQKIDDALPVTPELGELTYFFQKAASDNGLALKNVVLSQAAVSGGIRNLVFSVEATGNYNSLKSFVTDLETSDRLFEVLNVSFGSAPQSAANGSNGAASGNSALPAASSSVSSNQLFTFNLQVETHSY